MSPLMRQNTAVTVELCLIDDKGGLLFADELEARPSLQVQIVIGESGSLYDEAYSFLRKRAICLALDIKDTIPVDPEDFHVSLYLCKKGDSGTLFYEISSQEALAEYIEDGLLHTTRSILFARVAHKSQLHIAGLRERVTPSTPTLPTVDSDVTNQLDETTTSFLNTLAGISPTLLTYTNHSYAALWSSRIESLEAENRALRAVLESMTALFDATTKIPPSCSPHTLTTHGELNNRSIGDSGEPMTVNDLNGHTEVTSEAHFSFHPFPGIAALFTTEGGMAPRDTSAGAISPVVAEVFLPKESPNPRNWRHSALQRRRIRSPK